MRYHIRGPRLVKEAGYDDYVTVISAPRRYLDDLPSGSAYQHRVSYEDIAGWFDAANSLRVAWRRRSASTQHSVLDLREDPGIVDDGTQHLEARAFHLFESKRLGTRFTQQSNFIAELEQVVPTFYGRYGAALVAWQRPAPTIRGNRTGSSDVSPESISEEADSFVVDT